MMVVGRYGHMSLLGRRKAPHNHSHLSSQCTISKTSTVDINDRHSIAAVSFQWRSRSIRGGSQVNNYYHWNKVIRKKVVDWTVNPPIDQSYAAIDRI